MLAEDKVVKTQQTFVGCCVGDHTKTGIKKMIRCSFYLFITIQSTIV